MGLFARFDGICSLLSAPWICQGFSLPLWLWRFYNVDNVLTVHTLVIILTHSKTFFSISCSLMNENARTWKSMTLNGPPLQMKSLLLLALSFLSTLPLNFFHGPLTYNPFRKSFEHGSLCDLWPMTQYLQHEGNMECSNLLK